jgi:hypothetical protein
VEAGCLTPPAAGAAAADRPRPWFAVFASAWTALQPLDHAQRLAWLNAQAADRDLRNAAGRRIVFASADDAGTIAYEAHIFATGRVPTRTATAPNAHDLLNALVWLQLPRLKAALNARQAAEIERAGVQPTRGGARDAATLIDENGLLLAAEDAAVFELLSAHDWQRLFVDGRANWQAALRPQIVGHALLEKLARPYKSITAHVLPLAGRFDSLAALDAAAARWVAQPMLAPRLLLPLPVLGIPGWWPANAEPAFYDDVAVFRPARRAA